MLHRPLVSALVLGAALAAHAEDGIDFKFSGFGTLGAVLTNTDQAQYRASLRQDSGADKSPDLGVDSRLGLQAQVDFNPMFSAIGQTLLSRRDGKTAPQLEWLFGQAKLAPWVDVRAGRMVLPAFMLSDTRNVGFASHWIHAPHETYDTYPPTSFDGLQAVFRAEAGGVRFTAQPSWGKTESALYFALPGKSELKYPHIAALNLTAEYGDWTFRYGVVDGHKPRLENPSGDFAVASKDRFSGLGIQYDNGSLLLLSEYTTRRQDTKLFDSDALYLTAGYRFGAWTPYLTAARLDPKGPAYDNNAIDSTFSAGVRWDLGKNLALKYQLDRSTPSLQFTRQTAGFTASEGRYTIHSVALDFVF